MKMKIWIPLSFLTVPLALASATEDHVSLEVGQRVMSYIATSSVPAVVSPAEWEESEALYSRKDLSALLREVKEALTKRKIAYGFFVVDGTRSDDFSFDHATGNITQVSSKPSDATPWMIEIFRQTDGSVRGIRVSIGLVALGFELSQSNELRFLGAYRQEPL